MDAYPKALVGCAGFLLCLMLVSCGGSSPPGDFSLTSTPATIGLIPGGASQTISVSVAPVNGFGGAVVVAITGAPAGMTVSPGTLTLNPGTSQNVTVSASANAAVGNATLTFTGTSGSLSHAATVTATISAPPPDFTLTLAPTSATLAAGGANSLVSVTANAVNSFTGTVNVAITGLPAGVTASPATLSLAPGIAQTVTLTAASTATSATSTVTFTGTSGSLTHTAPLALTVQGAPSPDFTLTLAPTSATLAAGGTTVWLA